MKKVLIFILSAVVLLSSISIASADSRIAEYEKLLTGKWRMVSSINIGQEQYFGFSYPDNSIFLLYDESYTIDNIMDILLTEDSYGLVYLTIINNKSKKIGLCGKITFNEDGTKLLIISLYDGLYDSFGFGVSSRFTENTLILFQKAE